MNKKLFKLTTLALTSLMLTTGVSCNNSSSKGVVDFDPGTMELDKSKKIEIQFYHTMGKNLQEVFDSYLKDFNEIYPNIKVTHQAIGGYNDVRNQMTTTISSGKNEVNLAYCYPDHVALYNKSKQVISLDKLIYSKNYGLTKEEKKDFVSAYYDEGMSFGDGKMYTLPFSKSSEAMFYNKTFFEQHNLEVPTHWWSTDENDHTSLDYVIREIKRIDPNSIPLGYDSESNLFITLCEQLNVKYTSATGTSHYLFNNAEAKAFTKKIKAWYDEGLITTKGIYGSYTSTLFTGDDKNNKQCYICIGSTAGAGNQASDKFETGIAGIPQADENHKKVIQQGPNLCIFTSGDSDKVLASWIVAKYFATCKEFQCQFSMTSGYSPVLKSCQELPAYAEWLNEGSIQARATQVSLEQSDIFFTSPAFVGSSQARDKVGTMLQTILTQGKTDADIDKAFADAIVDLEK